MKRIILIVMLALSLGGSQTICAQGARDILGGIGSLLGGGAGSSDTTSTTQNGSGLGGLLGGVANVLGLGNTKPTIETLTGTWNYSSPAVNFKSENLLLKAGGAAASATVEQKLAPYYKTAGLTSLVLTVNADSTFTMKAKKATLKGQISVGDDSKTLIFHFQALGAINVGSLEAYTKQSGDNLELTFDVSKLKTVMKTVGSLSGNATINAATTLLNQYDGITAGFDLKRQK